MAAISESEIERRIEAGIAERLPRRIEKAIEAQNLNGKGNESEA